MERAERKKRERKRESFLGGQFRSGLVTSDADAIIAGNKWSEDSRYKAVKFAGSYQRNLFGTIINLAALETVADTIDRLDVITVIRRVPAFRCRRCNFVVNSSTFTSHRLSTVCPPRRSRMHIFVPTASVYQSLIYSCILSTKFPCRGLFPH